MSIYCKQCGENILPLANYCSYCGAEAPKQTIMITDEFTPENPIFCPDCSKLSFSDSLYCSWCGDFLYERNNSRAAIFCPKCGKKNGNDARICANCGLNLEDWFLMKGEVAENLGIKNTLTLHETMNDLYYHFVSNKSLTIGKSENSDIRINCPWVSRNHAIIDINSRSLIDNNSANSTFVNRKPDRITKLNFDDIQEFNIAGVFTFTLVKFKNAFAARLTAVLDEKECFKVGNPHALEELRKHYFIIIYGDVKIFIRRIDGYPEFGINNNEPMQMIEFDSGFFYFSNLKGNAKRRLITKKYSTLPANWVIIK